MTKYGLPEEVKYCTKCVISNQRPSSSVEYLHITESEHETISFDESGVCAACRFAEQKELVDWGQREWQLKKLCNVYRSRVGAFDCIVPGSGGKDSFYAAWRLKYDFGMHPLTVTWAPHIYTDWGRRNFDKWLNAGFDNILITPNPKTHRLLTRLAVENLFHPFQPFILGQKALAPRIAAQLRIPLVFYGEDEAEYGNSKQTSPTREGRFHAKPEIEPHIGGESLSWLKGKYGLTQSDLELYLPASQTLLDNVGVQVYYLGYYLKWRPQSCYYFAVENGGFEPAPERSPGTYSKYNSVDDRIDDFHYWTTYQKFGIGRATYDAAQEIRSDEINREEGVALVHRYDGEWPSRFLEEVNEYLSVPNFTKMTDDHWWELARQFRSPHLWDGEKLRYQIR